MKKNMLVLEWLVLFMASSALFLLSGCASTSEVQGTEGELWMGKLTGMVDADLKLYFSRIEEDEATYLVKGHFSGEIDNVAGGHGSGRMSGVIAGQVKEGKIDVRMRGTATVSEGSASITGKMAGALSNTQAFGSWNIDARSSEGSHRFSGEWHADKTGSAMP